MTAESSFAGKFLQRLRRIDPDQVESFLAQVLREKAILEQVFDALTDGLILTEGHSKVAMLNSAARGLLGLGRVECIGKDIVTLLKARALQALADEFCENSTAINFREIHVRTPEVRNYAVTVVPIENDEGLMTHAVWIISDRTEARRVQNEKRHIDNLEALAALTAGVAHEVKNPLNSLNIHAQLIEKGARKLLDDPNEQALERLEKSTGVILEEINRLTRIVDNFIRSVGPVRLQLRKESPNKVMLDLAELMGPQISKKSIELTLDLDPEMPQVLIDPEQITQALLNLVKNAMEAIEDKGGKITVRTQLRSDHALIEVADNGCGIAEQDRLRIFEPYHTTKFSGTGLGLMVVYRIIRAHRGAVGLTSELGVGTVFSVALPLDERPVKMLSAQVEPDLQGLDTAHGEE